MFPKILAFFYLACFGSRAFAFDNSKWEAAKQKFEQADAIEAARQEYVNALAGMLGSETAAYMANSHDEEAGRAIDKLDAELKAHHAPGDTDSNMLSKLRVGKWQATRHTSVYNEDGTWKMTPKSGTATGHWRIEGNRYFDDDDVNTIICLTDKYFVFTNGEDVFYEQRLSESV